MRKKTRRGNGNKLDLERRIAALEKMVETQQKMFETQQAEKVVLEARVNHLESVCSFSLHGEFGSDVGSFTVLGEGDGDPSMYLVQ